MDHANPQFGHHHQEKEQEDHLSNWDAGAGLYWEPHMPEFDFRLPRSGNGQGAGFESVEPDEDRKDRAEYEISKADDDDLFDGAVVVLEDFVKFVEPRHNFNLVLIGVDLPSDRVCVSTPRNCSSTSPD